MPAVSSSSSPSAKPRLDVAAGDSESGVSPLKLGQSTSAPVLSDLSQLARVTTPASRLNTPGADSIALARHCKIASHLAAPKRKPRQRKSPPPQLGVRGWNDRHQLCGTENELLPKRQRRYFSRPQTEKKLRKELERNPPSWIGNMTSTLKRMDKEEEPPPRPTPFSADAGPPVIPSRHEIGGSMRDHIDHEIQPWNSRHGQGVGTMNDGMHLAHREYFSKPSVFAKAPSQRWRRYADVEVTVGVWKPIKENPSRF